MQYTALGDSGIRVSRVSMGCMGFGEASAGQHSWTLDEDASREIIAYGLEQGITFFDTAIGYQGGTSEQYLGRALRQCARREEVVVATKFLPRPAQAIDAGLSGAEHLRQSLEASLRNLGMDHVDLYILHMWDWGTPIEEYLAALTRAVREGKVRAIGIANAFAWQVAQANALAQAHGWERFVSVQNHYNLLFREEEREMTVFADQNNIALTPYSALAGGRLARPVGTVTRRLREDAYARMKYDATAEADAVVIDRVAQVAARHSASMTEVSLAWLLTRTAAPVVGMTKRSHVEGAVGAMDLVLDDADLAALEEAYVPHPLVGVMAQNTPAAARPNRARHRA